MSDKERPKGDVIGGGPDDEGGEGPTSTGDPKDINCKGCKKKGKRVSLFRLRKAKKWLPQKRKQKGIYLNTVCCRRRAGGGGGWCCLCVKQPITVGSSVFVDFSSSDIFRQITEDGHGSNRDIMHYNGEFLRGHFKRISIPLKIRCTRCWNSYVLDAI